MSRFTVSSLPLSGLQCVQRHQIEDSRGYLSRLFCTSELESVGWPGGVAQINQTLTRKRGTVRGMHFQYPPHAETKLVMCLTGAVFDVAVDLRKASPTFMQWHAQELTSQNGLALLIPEGFAHGFQTLTDDCELLYVHSAAYHREAEGAVNALDPALGIAWPLPVADRSERDVQHPMLSADFEGITL